MQGYLEKREAANTRRTLLPHRSQLIDLSSNDALQLSRHPSVLARSQQAIEEWGCGARASRLITGNLPIHEALEGQLASLCGTETALLFASGYQANLSLLPALVDRHSRILIDRLAHHSLIQGARLSGAEVVRFRHNDLSHLEQLIPSERPTWVVTESVFSMDGDQAPIDAIRDLCTMHGARLYLDDAHWFGILGTVSRGDATLVPFGKAVGNFGAALACSHLMKEYLLNRCGGVIYSTALPPAVIGGVSAALELIPVMDQERARLLHLAQRLRRALGKKTTEGCSHIIPYIVGECAQAVELSARLEEAGFLALPIRPPTVPAGTARLRLSLHTGVAESEVKRLLTLLQNSAFFLSDSVARRVGGNGCK